MHWDCKYIVTRVWRILDKFHQCIFLVIVQYKDYVYMYMDFHYKDKATVGPNYLHTRYSYTVKTASIYWNTPGIRWTVNNIRLDYWIYFAFVWLPMQRIFLGSLELLLYEFVIFSEIFWRLVYVYKLHHFYIVCVYHSYHEILCDCFFYIYIKHCFV